MFNYNEKIAAYLEAHFIQGDPNHPGVLKFTTGKLLGFLWDAFPKNCISDYDLNEILIDLGYERKMWMEEREVISEDDDEISTKMIPELVTGWVLKSREYDLTPDIWTEPKESKRGRK